MADERRGGNYATRYLPPPTPLANAMLAYQPPPPRNSLAEMLYRYGVEPFQGYLRRQGELAQGGLDMADQGAQQVRGGDLSGLVGQALGPLNYLASPVTALLPTSDETYAANDLPEWAKPGVAGGLAGMMAIMPGPKFKGAGKIANAAAEAAPEGITAYHGSPHTFDKFDMSKIGTGEGAQAYGHGLYFAENEGVATGYRNTLTNKVASDPSYWDGVKLPNSLTRAEQGELSSLSMELRNNGNLGAADKSRWNELHAKDRAYNDAVQAAKPSGSIYQVRINAKPEEFLDWNAPLRQQSDTVKKALAENGISGDPRGNSLRNERTGSELLKMLGPSGSREATDLLKAQGVKGIRYKDAGSRGGEGGTYNYVVFDDSIIDILKRYGIPMTAGVGGAMVVSGQNMPPELAAQMPEG